MADYKQRLELLLCDKLNVKQEALLPKARFKEDLGADSLDMADLVVDIEKEFNISITDEEAETLITVEDVENYIQMKQTMRSDN